MISNDQGTRNARMHAWQVAGHAAPLSPKGNAGGSSGQRNTTRLPIPDPCSQRVQWLLTVDADLFGGCKEIAYRSRSFIVAGSSFDVTTPIPFHLGRWPPPHNLPRTPDIGILRQEKRRECRFVFCHFDRCSHVNIFVSQEPTRNPWHRW